MVTNQRRDHKRNFGVSTQGIRMITADPTVSRAMVVDVMATPGSIKLQQKDGHLSHVAMFVNMAAFESFLWLTRPSATVVFLTREVGELCITSTLFFSAPNICDCSFVSLRITPFHWSTFRKTLSHGPSSSFSHSCVPNL